MPYASLIIAGIGLLHNERVSREQKSDLADKEKKEKKKSRILQEQEAAKAAAKIKGIETGGYGSTLGSGTQTLGG